MSHYNLRLNLSALPSTFFATIKGRQTEKKCLCIPIDEAHLFCGKSGTYLDLTAMEMKEPKYDSTHYIKAQLPKELYRNLSEEERKNQPILGDMRPFSLVDAPVMNASPEDDLPF